MTPHVSVIIPTRDRLPALQRALASVDAQTFRNYEVVVVDDGSAGGTRGWLASAATGARVVTHERPRGASVARNRGIDEARGELIAFLDDDDVWAPSYLSEQVRQMDADADAVLSWADHVECDPEGRVRRPDTTALLAYRSVLVRMLAEAFIHSMSVVVCRRAVFHSLGPFGERLQVVQDHEWYCRLLAAGQRFVHLPRVLVTRSVPGGLVAQHRRWHEEERVVIDEILSRAIVSAGDRRLIRAYRSVFFAHRGFAQRDLVFGATRLVEALGKHPAHALHIATRRMLRRLTRATSIAHKDAAP